ncbi:MAG: exodeoxyribonuclease VII small subunit [Gammaproteobacteria bacterium]|jgi:exodeoxyribonuclease VII small subunit|nr:exodeoxyribonuclease VII small subunit [Gammaproteobacteria bacterium]MBT6755258.1 exodeoxyribonuclease VII small subunit [Gammaproteobacteria bacterium]MBT7523128.1 exodeoxyribonuclease VII small subunit [Gammaproteobacteria bacterium]MBT7814331.1 exodeoxyribonuclease VII small subunit [Gammaproteobacteria bacterium]MDA9896515.1 exodeoxyribonuclease VII small subunit [Gammaproteobacteria bacterium]|tara:strand:+ start:19 stop:405 length:387 start_codon:yes stop_codon:yes gene_type:complete
MKKEKNKTYESILEELENIISKLNSSNIPIENSIKLYEDGVRLSNEADKELLAIEKNIQKIKKVKVIDTKSINIEKSFIEIDKIIENLEDEEISINEAESYYKKALLIIFNIESYLKKAKSVIKKYEQ